MTNKRYEKLLANYEKHCKRIYKATTVNINESPKDKAARIKEKEKTYKAWFEYHFPQYAKVSCSWYQIMIADLIIRFPIIYLLVEIFRSGGKTVHINMGIPLYLYYVKKELWYMVLIGQTAAKAKRLLSGIQAQIRYNQRLINDYGERYKYGDWSEEDFGTVDEARFRCFGFGQSPRGEQEEGKRPDYITCDDCDIKKHLNNAIIMAERENFVFEDLLGCFDSADVGYQAKERFIYANNNFHKKSLTNRLKKRFEGAVAKAKQRGTLVKHKVVSVGAVNEVGAIGDPTKFISQWPEKTSREYWIGKYQDYGHASFMREFMNTHIEEGNLFKPENMQWKQMLPLDQYEGLAWYGDLSYKEQGDFKGMMLVGKHKREMHIIKTYLRQSSRADVAAWVYDTYEEMGMQDLNLTIKIEGLFAQDEFISDFDTEGDLRGWHIPVIADKRSKEGKYDRVAGTQGYFQRRWVFFNIEEKDTADQIELLDQYYSFERGSSAHDDGPDAVHGAFRELMESAQGGNLDNYRVGMIDYSDNPNTF